MNEIKELFSEHLTNIGKLVLLLLLEIIFIIAARLLQCIIFGQAKAKS